MRKFWLVVAFLSISVVGTTGAASAHNGEYGQVFATVAPSTTVVQPGAPFTVTAKNFCPGKTVHLTLINRSHTYSQNVVANGSGQAVASFNPPTVAAGLYLIVASSGSPCNRVAFSYVQVLEPSTCTPRRTNGNGNNSNSNGKNEHDNEHDNEHHDDHCASHHIDAFSLASEWTPGDIDSMVASLASAPSSSGVQAAVLAESISAVPTSATLPVTGSNGVSTVRLGLVAVLAGFGLLYVGRRRRGGRSFSLTA